jgi:hypothetical protein
MKIFVIGFHRTGTRSICHALKLMGYSVINCPTPKDDPHIFDEFSAGLSRWNCLKHFDGVAGLPTIPHWPGFYKEYPDSAFILPVRDLQTWLPAAERHYLKTEKLRYHGILPAREFDYMDMVRLAVYGCSQFNARRYAQVFEDHRYRAVRAFTHGNVPFTLMDLERGDGWKELLDVIPPAYENCQLPSEFPHLGAEPNTVE